MLVGTTKHVGKTRLSANTKLRPRIPPMQVRRIQPAKKLLTKSLGNLSFRKSVNLILNNLKRRSKWAKSKATLGFQ